MSLLPPEFCPAARGTAVKSQFRTFPLPACVGSLGSSCKPGGAARMRPGREGSRMLLGRSAASTGWAAAELLLFHSGQGGFTWGWGCPPVVLSHCSAGEIGCFWTRFGSGFIKAFLAAWHRDAEKRKHLLASGTPQCVAGLVCNTCRMFQRTGNFWVRRKEMGGILKGSSLHWPSPWSMAAQLKVAFAWAALKIPQWWRFCKLSRPSVPEFYSSYFGGSVWIAFLIPHG